jgi:hypothetical protein
MPERERSGRVLLRMPISLHEYLVERAGAESVSLNMFICTVLAGEAGWAGPRDPQRRRQDLRREIEWEMWQDRLRR